MSVDVQAWILIFSLILFGFIPGVIVGMEISHRDTIRRMEKDIKRMKRELEE